MVTACAATGGDSTGAGGDTTGGGGAGGGGGNSGAGAGFGMGGPFTFPQNKMSGSCALTKVANAAGAAQAAYDFWKSRFVTSSGAPSGFLRVQRDPGSGNDTVSEGIGYGMLAAVYRGDQTTFDGLWGYAKAHFDGHQLMTWHISSSGSVVEAGSASDGDEDMAWALLMASDQWSSNASYLDDAKSVINNMFFNEIGPDGRFMPGDSWGADLTVFPDYFSPAYYRAFAKVSGNNAWVSTVLEKGYATLAQVTGSDGLIPDNINAPSGKMKPNYGYDACRTPWRIAMDYCFNNEPRALAYLMKIGTFFNGVGASNIVDGYSSTGSVTSGNKNMAFIGPAGVSGMAGYSALLDGAFNYGAANNGGDMTYFPQSLRVISMLMMSGNFLDYSQQAP
jgi:endo-1,4-beta-D-glucanase Y